MTASRVSASAMPWGTLVRLCAPEVRNALDARAVDDLIDVVRRCDRGVVVLAGTGPSFCAGGDLTALSAAAGDGSAATLVADAGRRFAELVESMVRCPQPLVAALHGAVVGGGLSLALACDFRVAGRSTRLVPGWGRWGLPPDGGATALLAGLIGPAAAAGVLMRGAELGVEHPLAPLLLSAVVDDAEVLTTAVALAEELQANPGAVAAKAVTRPLLLPLLRSQCEVELAALAEAAAARPAGYRISR